MGQFHENLREVTNCKLQPAEYLRKQLKFSAYTSSAVVLAWCARWFVTKNHLEVLIWDYLEKGRKFQRNTEPDYHQWTRIQMCCEVAVIPNGSTLEVLHKCNF